MTRPVGVVCAAGCCLLLGWGCASLPFRVSARLWWTADGTCAGPVDVARLAGEEALRLAGVTATVCQEDDGTRLAGVTPRGQAVNILLTPREGSRGGLTRVHVEWEDGPDEDLGHDLLKVMKDIAREVRDEAARGAGGERCRSPHPLVGAGRGAKISGGAALRHRPS